MEVRRARLDDMAMILDYLEEYHQTSNMRDVPFVRPDTAKVVQYYVRAPECVVLIAENEGKVTGLLAASVEPFPINAKKRWASDLFFIAKGGGPALLRHFKEWATSMGAIRIIMGVSSGDPRGDRLLELNGFEQTGGMHVFCCESS